MLHRISDKVNRVSTGKVTLAGLVIFILFTLLVLPTQSAGSDSEAGTPDLSLYYSPAALYRIAEDYGPQGRSDYVVARFTFDLIWPLVYTLFLATSISWIATRTYPAGSRLQRANLAPLLGMLFDYLENISTSLVMLRYPAQTPLIDTLAPVFTLLKWLFIAASFAFLLVGGVTFLLRKSRRT